MGPQTRSESKLLKPDHEWQPDALQKDEEKNSLRAESKRGVGYEEEPRTMTNNERSNRPFVVEFKTFWAQPPAVVGYVSLLFISTVLADIVEEANLENYDKCLWFDCVLETVCMMAWDSASLLAKFGITVAQENITSKLSTKRAGLGISDPFSANENSAASTCAVVYRSREISVLYGLPVVVALVANALIVSILWKNISSANFTLVATSDKSSTLPVFLLLSVMHCSRYLMLCIGIIFLFNHRKILAEKYLDIAGHGKSPKAHTTAIALHKRKDE